MVFKRILNWLGLDLLSDSRAHYELWRISEKRNADLIRANWRCSRGWSEAQTKINLLEGLLKRLENK